MADDDRLMDRDLRRAIGAVVTLLLGVAGLGWTGWLGVTYLRLGDGSVTHANGAVVGCHPETGKNAHGTVLTLQFPAPGVGLAHVTTHSDQRRCSEAEAGPVSVRFRTNDPEVAMADRDYETAPERLLGLGLMSLFLLGVGVAMSWSRFRPAPSENDTIRNAP